MTTIWTELLGAETKFYDVNGIRTRVLTAGTGPALLMLHGSGGHAEAYARNIKPLSEYFQVISMDYLGCGLTDYPDHAPSMQYRVDHIIGLMDAMGIEKATIAGESFGGTHAFAAVRAHPERFSKLIIIVGGLYAEQADKASFDAYKAGMTAYVQKTRAAVGAPPREAVRERLAWLFHKPDRDISDELVDIRWTFYQREAARRMLVDMADMVEYDLEAQTNGVSPDERTDPFRPLTERDLAAIDLPTLFIWSDHNPSIQTATARNAAARMPNARFVEMKDCAHWPQWEDAPTFNNLVLQFMRDDAQALAA